MKKVNYKNFGHFNTLGVAWTKYPDNTPLTKKSEAGHPNTSLDSPWWDVSQKYLVKHLDIPAEFIKELQNGQC